MTIHISIVCSTNLILTPYQDQLHLILYSLNDGEVEMLNNYSIVSAARTLNLSEQLNSNSVFDGIVNIDLDNTNEVISRITG